MSMIARPLQGAATKAVGWFERAIQEVVRAAEIIFAFAADHMLIVAAIVAVIGVILLRPPHTPR